MSVGSRRLGWSLSGLGWSLSGPGWSLIGMAFLGMAVPALAQQAPPTISAGEVYEIVHPGSVDSSLGAKVDATTLLVRNDDGVAMTFDTKQLRPRAPYTAWWVVFNNPELCREPCACGFPDVFDAAQAEDVETAVFWATGRVTDRYGQAHFSGAVGVGEEELPTGDDQVVFGPGLLDPDAEIHLVTRTHGRERHPERRLEKQLTEFNGLCSPNCFDQQVSVHRSPTCE